MILDNYSDNLTQKNIDGEILQNLVYGSPSSGHSCSEVELRDGGDLEERYIPSKVGEKVAESGKVVLDKG